MLCAACAQPTASEDKPTRLTDKVDARLGFELSAGIPKDVLVLLAEPAADSGDDSVAGQAQAIGTEIEALPNAEARKAADAVVAERAALYADLQDKVVEAVAGHPDIEIETRYENIPMMFVRLDSLEGLELLVAQPEVAHVYENTSFEHTLAASLPQIRQLDVAATGRVGAGATVAVLDTGVDFTRAAFGSCSAPGVTGCKVQYANDFATNDNQADAHGHGTNVAAIVLGVAPGAKVLALDVFNGGTAPGNAILSAIDWTIANRNTYNIAAMNLSLGSGSYSSPCTTDYFATAITNARNAGILAAIASGNGALSSAIASPACVPAAISVGAVYDGNVGGVSYSACSDASTTADKVTCFSNSASFLSVLAPGAPISAGGIVMSGTSQAAPHVAGAIAVLRAAFSSESLNQIAARVTDTGRQVTDPRNNVTKRRLDLQAAVTQGGTDITPPTGSVTINAGANATNKGSVVLTIAAADGGKPVPSMCVSNTSTCTAFGAYVSSKTWSLTSGDGTKTVYVSLKDSGGNVTKVSDTIMRDAKLPTNPTLSAVAGNAKVDLSWTAASDSSSIAAYRLVFSNGTTSPSTCTTGVVAYSGTAQSVSLPASNGLQYNYRLCALDTAGNLGTGATATARPAPERIAPTGSVVIAAGARYTKTPSVTLALSAADDSSVASMCISNTTSRCTSFVAFAATKSWSLSSTGTVYVWFRDVWGNQSTSAASDSILLDKSAPSMGSFTATPSRGSVALAWAAASDAAGSGVLAYKLVWAKSTTAPSCTAGSTAYNGPLLAFAHTGLTAGKYSYRLCASDVVGNVSSGLTRTVTVP
jgi:hypothetical protein